MTWPVRMPGKFVENSMAALEKNGGLNLCEY